MDGSERLRGFDAMRAPVVVGLIFFHLALIFDTRDDYYVKNGQTVDLSALAALGVVWAMPLLFLTAGLGVWHSLNRRTVAAFAAERLRRLLVPLVFGILVLMPIPVWFRMRPIRRTRTRTPSSTRGSCGSGCCRTSPDP